MTQSAKNAPFGSLFSDSMAIARFEGGAWSPYRIEPLAPIPIHPAAHVLHYASECFEGFKAYRWADGSIHLFRMDKNLARFRQSAAALALPLPDLAAVAEMVTTLVDRHSLGPRRTSAPLRPRPRRPV